MLNKNSSARKGLNVGGSGGGIKVGGESIIEKCPVDLDIIGMVELERGRGGKSRRASCSILNLNQNSNNGNSSNGIMIENNDTIFPCTCPVVGDTKMLIKTPKTATTILSKSSSFVTKTHCPVCGGCSSMNGSNGGRVTFGFLGKVRNKSVNNIMYRNRHDDLINDTTTTITTPLNYSPSEENNLDEIPMIELATKSNGYVQVINSF
jgi:hypothetical protein